MRKNTQIVPRDLLATMGKILRGVPQDLLAMGKYSEGYWCTAVKCYRASQEPRASRENRSSSIKLIRARTVLASTLCQYCIEYLAKL